MIRILFFLPILLGMVCNTAFAQNDYQVSDSTHTLTPLDHAIKHYYDAFGNQAALYNGTEYIDYKFQTEGHPFFLSNHWSEGTVYFDGMRYPGVLMLYDIVDEAVVIALQNTSESLFNKIRIDLDRVQSFSMKGHEFVRLAEDSGANMEKGFYDLLYAGDSKVVAKRAKTAKKEVALLIYKQHDRFFIKKDGLFHPVKNKASVLKLFKEHKRELAGYLRDNKINFNDNRDFAIVSLAKQYDLLSK